MRILGQLTLQEAARKHADVTNALVMWRAAVAAATWTSLTDLKAHFPSADYVPPFIVFNVKGNRYRLVTLIDFGEQTVVVREVLTHAAYSKGRWR